jgi:transcriptional regulator with PAS, ATPase and Fis domain
MPSFTIYSSKKMTLTPDLPLMHDDGELNALRERLEFLLKESPIPKFDREKLDPVLKLWHLILKEQTEKGRGIKEVAMLLFSLKSSLLEKGESHDPHLDELLDWLGILTFELYSTERERLVFHQSQQIAFLSEAKDADIIGNSPHIRSVFSAVDKIKDLDVTVLLEGESGTGKELIASLIHRTSLRKNKPFITLNCGAIPKDLVESELFGHEKGAFTGADAHKPGKFELAHEGTLFLDEVSELSLDAQVKLLRALQNHEIERVGGTEKIHIDVRIIAASNVSLKEAVDDKRFRLDLFYRLHVYPIFIAPLRDRKEDIPLLARFFVSKYVTQFGISDKFLTEDAIEFLESQLWEGNVRELENVIQRAIILSPNDWISAEVLSFKPGKSSPLELTVPSSGIVPLEVMEKRAIEQALTHFEGNVSKASEALGISRSTFYNKARAYGL